MYEQIKEKIARRYKKELHKFKSLLFSTYSKKVVKVINYPFFELKIKEVVHFDIFGEKFISSRNKEDICIETKFLKGDNQINVNHKNKRLSETIISRLCTIEPAYNLINWERDFLSGYSWQTRKFNSDIDHLVTHKGVDIKSVWELSRLQHLSFLLHKNKTKEVICHILDFIASQPPKFGPNWKCSMEVGIRATNILLAYGAIKETSNIDSQLQNDVLEIISRSLNDHVLYIGNNLEVYNGQGNNHYLSNLSTLIILTNALGLKKEFSHYQHVFIGEVKKQFHPEGTNFEGSTNYHRLSSELFFYAIYFTTISDNLFDGQNHLEVAIKIWGKDVINLLYNVFDSFLYILKPNGEIPNIGDNDSGRFLIFDHTRSISDGRYLLAIGAVFFKEARWKIKEFVIGDQCNEVKILFGNSLRNWFKESNSMLSLKDIPSKVFNDAGWAIMRDCDNYCIISLGRLGTNGSGGHDHDDKLSYELVISGKNVVVDRGTYCYTSDPVTRKEFCSISSHNLPIFSGHEQNKWINLFKRKENALPNLIHFSETESEICFKGAQFGYGGEHVRDIIWNKKNKELIVSDSFSNEIQKCFDFNQLYSYESNIAIDFDGEAEIYDSEISPGYRVLRSAKKYIIRSQSYKVYVK